MIMKIIITMKFLRHTLAFHRHTCGSNVVSAKKLLQTQQSLVTLNLMNTFLHLHLFLNAFFTCCWWCENKTPTASASHPLLWIFWFFVVCERTKQYFQDTHLRQKLILQKISFNLLQTSCKIYFWIFQMVICNLCFWITYIEFGKPYN